VSVDSRVCVVSRVSVREMTSGCKAIAMACLCAITTTGPDGAGTVAGMADRPALYTRERSVNDDGAHRLSAVRDPENLVAGRVPA
jgi:hypothetical protein